MLCFFFFKQKTAYEMRISDWSSDVCSSDLVEGRTPPQRQRRGQHLSVGADQPACVDAVGRQQDVARDRDVGGREAELAAALVAVGDDASHLVGTTEHGPSAGQVALGQRVAYGGRGRLLTVGRRVAVGVDESEAVDLEAELGTHGAEELDVASALVAEVEVLPHDHDLGAEAPDEDLPDEVLSEIGRASCRERVCQYVSISGVAVSLKKK